MKILTVPETYEIIKLLIDCIWFSLIVAIAVGLFRITPILKKIFASYKDVYVLEEYNQGVRRQQQEAAIASAVGTNPFKLRQMTESCNKWEYRGHTLFYDEGEKIYANKTVVYEGYFDSWDMISETKILIRIGKQIFQLSVPPQGRVFDPKKVVARHGGEMIGQDDFDEFASVGDTIITRHENSFFLVSHDDDTAIKVSKKLIYEGPYDNWTISDNYLYIYFRRGGVVRFALDAL